MMRALASVSVTVGAIISIACHRASVVKLEECQAKSVGTASVELGAAETRDARYGGLALGGLVIRVQQGTVERPPLPDAVAAIVLGGTGKDSGQLAMARVTPTTGVVIIDSLVVKRYDLLVRRIGYDVARQRVRVRAGFVDTVTFALRGAAFCLVE